MYPLLLSSDNLARASHPVSGYCDNNSSTCSSCCYDHSHYLRPESAEASWGVLHQPTSHQYLWQDITFCFDKVREQGFRRSFVGMMFIASLKMLCWWSRSCGGMVKLRHFKNKPLLNLIFVYSKPKLQAVKINLVLLLSADFLFV